MVISRTSAPNLRRLRFMQFGELEAADAVRKAGVVLDEVGERHLAAGHVALQHDGAQAAAGAVDGGGEAGGTGADDDDVVFVGVVVALV